MSRDALRFAVGEPEGRRSAVWRAWHSSDDVYVAARALGGVLKASLHRSGDCFAGFTSEYAQQARARGMLAPGKSRQTLSWVGRPLNEDVTLLMRILIPGSQLESFGDPQLGSKSAEWIPAPPPGQVTEVAVFKGRPGIVFPQWPGARSMQTRQLGRFLLPSGSFCHFVWRHTSEMNGWAEAQVAEIRQLAHKERERWLTPELASHPETLRMIVLGYDNDYRVGVLMEAGIGDLNRPQGETAGHNAETRNPA